ncbi:Uncharacterized transporter C4B3.13 [Taphrina deformans PYCC 5710]|uniref:Uncharacterized transporter C4B3.13 n=1 Tax=Taphrina deformans (strain PYCC 5710 / ATCC 11124 / CBS 356.35 / IMI 108563 / JCM 9778 / NBRC 8474) TaxID=1097556 RepID=R4X9I1_TAPDE|nr:Uncharacterized transporter C4B3.13 [Taphrina deformans PYCC 5710]|eukprot:CCG82375.1 Uncharacterized transporter C4B3.13 [Taphrina deformans PYCC 5710]
MLEVLKDDLIGSHKRRDSNDSERTVSALHLSESYSRPVFVLGSRPLLFNTIEDVLPQGYLTRDERTEFDSQEQVLLENNDLLPNQSHALDVVMEEEEPIDETSSLLTRQYSHQLHNDDGQQAVREIPRAERRKLWEEAVEAQKVKTSWKYEARLLSSSATPLIATFALQYSMQFASIFSLGHLGRTELASASLGSMSQSITLIAFAQGIATALDTLCAQSFGANQPHLVGLHLQRCLLLLWLCLVPIAAIWFTSEQIFLHLNQTPEVARLASLYLKVLFIGAPGYIGFEALKRFTASQGNFRVSTYAVCITAPINAILNYVLVWHPDIGLGFAGAPLAMSISYWLSFLLMIGFVKYGKSRHAWHGFSSAAFKHWMPMLQLALPGCLMTCSEWFAYEIMAFSSSFLGVVPLGAQAVLSTTGSLTYQIPFAVAVGISSRVGNLLGAGLAGPARTATLVGVVLSGMIGCLVGTAIFALRYDWGRLFSDDFEVVTLAARLLPLCALFNLADCIQVITAGILRGQGRQHIGGILNLVGYYLMAIPLGLVLCFKVGLGLAGLWIGMCVAIWVISLIQAYYVLSVDWEVLVEEVQLRIAGRTQVAQERHLE